MAVPAGWHRERIERAIIPVRPYAARYQPYQLFVDQTGRGLDLRASFRPRRRDRGRTRFRRIRFATSGAKRIEAREDNDDGDGTDDDPGDAWAHGPVLRPPRPSDKCLAGTLRAPAG